MLKIEAPNYQFCPFCGDKLSIKSEEGKERKFCSKDNWIYYPHVTAAAAGVILKENKLLLVQRNREPYKDKWMFPAGFLEYGEHPEEAVKRETAEETGFIVANPRLLKVIQVDDDPREKGHFNFFYQVEIEAQEAITDQEENKDIKWFELDNLPEIAWNSHQTIARLLKEGKL